jgi:uncharacterized membrane protein
MRAWKSALAVAVCALGLGLLPAAHAQFKPTPAPGGGGGGPAAPSAPQAQGDQFTFKVCNRSKIPLFVAMLYKVDGGAWRTVGWSSFKPGVCAPVRGTYPRNDFYWYAEDAAGNVSYAGKDAYGCINSNDGFDRTVSGDYQCAPNEKIVGFTKIDAKSIQDGITLTD